MDGAYFKHYSSVCKLSNCFSTAEATFSGLAFTIIFSPSTAIKSGAKIDNPFATAITSASRTLVIPKARLHSSEIVAADKASGT